MSQECETGYDTKKGVECWESVKGKHPDGRQSLFDRHHAAAHPQGGGRQDPNAVHGLWPVGLGGRQGLPLDLQSAGHLLGRHVAGHPLYRRKEGGLDKLKGKKIGFIYLDVGYGREPIPLLKDLAKDYGFTVKLYPVGGKEMQDQSASGWPCAAIVRTG